MALGILKLAGGLVGIVKGGVDWALGRQKEKQREADKDAGRTEVERDQLKEGANAQQRMDSVDPAGSESTDDKLRKGEF